MVSVINICCCKVISMGDRAIAVTPTSVQLLLNFRSQLSSTAEYIMSYGLFLFEEKIMYMLLKILCQKSRLAKCWLTWLEFNEDQKIILINLILLLFHLMTHCFCDWNEHIINVNNNTVMIIIRIYWSNECLTYEISLFFSASDATDLFLQTTWNTDSIFVVPVVSRGCWPSTIVLIKFRIETQPEGINLIFSTADLGHRT